MKVLPSEKSTEQLFKNHRRDFAACSDKCVGSAVCVCVMWENCVYLVVAGCGAKLWMVRKPLGPQDKVMGFFVFLFCILSPSYTEILKFPCRDIRQCCEGKIYYFTQFLSH